jgi:hypothetical protein
MIAKILQMAFPSPPHPPLSPETGGEDKGEGDFSEEGK